MFYRPSDGHGLPHNPFSAIISPRPIAWVSTRGADGHDNLAPYSFFTAAAYEPPQVMFASTGAKPDRDGTKDSVANIRETGVFAVNVVSFDHLQKMNKSSAPLAADQDEFAHAEVVKDACSEIDCARVGDAPATLECRLTQIVPLPGEVNFAVFGQVVGVHLRDDCMVEGTFDVTRYTPLARLGYMDYTAVRDLFEMRRP